LSGGLDSEFAANCLFDRGVNFTPIIMDIHSNRIENWYAHYWCYEKRIKPLIITMNEKDVIKTFSKISEEKNIPFYCSIPIILSEIV
jgi:adenylyl- and sulfurtransferase ThiI